MLGDDDNIITIKSNSNSITTQANKGNDKIISYNSDNTYIYKRGDGADVILDFAGSDALKLIDISKDEVTLKKDKTDLVLIIDNLNSIKLKDYFLKNTKIESIIFQDAELELSSILALTSDDMDVIDLSNIKENITISGFGSDYVSKSGFWRTEIYQ